MNIKDHKICKTRKKQSLSFSVTKVLLYSWLNKIKAVLLINKLISLSIHVFFIRQSKIEAQILLKRSSKTIK